MKETLVVVAHPDLASSKVNQCWINELSVYADQVTIHDLYASYSSNVINAVSEQILIENHRNLILQFPLYWFNCPPLLKLWLDEVLTYGWAFGRNGLKLKNKKVGLAVSAGIRKSDYAPEGRFHVSLDDILKPFELTMNYVQANYQSVFAVYGANNEPEAGYGITQEEIDNSARDYIHWMKTSEMLK
ncbi:NAD(P)H-dependent oxidoreductase [Snodgrassella alvi]|uniref:NAD(P)H-dependent oxidoreductase n=1 Tax=Snodgrassella alvi TaxID=1196083 RepID=UPI0034600B73